MSLNYYETVLLIMLILLVFDFLIVNVFLVRLWPKVQSKWRLIVYVIIIMIYIIPNFRVMFTRNTRSSPVDASFIALIEPEQLNEEHMVMTIDSLQELDNVSRFEKQVRSHYVSERLIYSLTYRHESGSVSIRVHVYWSEQRLIDVLPSWEHLQTRRHSAIITNDNNTQAFLHATFSPMSHLLPAPWRSLRTELRLGNVHITLSEDRARDDYYPNASTAFIQMLYELLTAEQTPTQ